MCFVLSRAWYAQSMHASKCFHPPAASTSLLSLLGTAKVSVCDAIETHTESETETISETVLGRVSAGSARSHLRAKQTKSAGCLYLCVGAQVQSMGFAFALTPVGTGAVSTHNTRAFSLSLSLWFAFAFSPVWTGAVGPALSHT